MPCNGVACHDFLGFDSLRDSYEGIVVLSDK